MRTRLLKFARGGASVALLASGLGVVGALGFGLATSGVASAAGVPVSGTYECTAGLPTKLPLAGTVVDHTTAPATLHIGSTYSVTPYVTLAVTGALLALAAKNGEYTLHVSGSKLALTATGGTLAAATDLQTGSASHTIGAPWNSPTFWWNTHNTPHTTAKTITPATYPTPATIQLKFDDDTLTMTASAGTHAVVTSGELKTTVVTSVKCQPTNYAHPVSFGAIDTITSSGYAPLALAPATGTRLTDGQVGVTYTHGHNFWTASGGHGNYTWHATVATQDGLSFSTTGAHASITGTPTTAEATVCWSVSVITLTEFEVTYGGTEAAALAGGAIIHHTDCMTVLAAPATPKVVQPFKLTVTPGNLTLTCTSTATGPHAANDVTTQADARNCTLITLGHVTLDQARQTITTTGHPLIISTARGEPTSSWGLYAVMVPSSTAKAPAHATAVNGFCGYVQGFCDATTTTTANLTPAHLKDTSILPQYLHLAGYHCKPNNATPATPYYNTNTTPTTTPGSYVNATGLSTEQLLCTSAAGSAGGEFFVTTLKYKLTVPPNIYAGTYYGTVQYTLSTNATVAPHNPTTPKQ